MMLIPKTVTDGAPELLHAAVMWKASQLNHLNVIQPMLFYWQ